MRVVNAQNVTKKKTSVTTKVPSGYMMMELKIVSFFYQKQKMN